MQCKLKFNKKQLKIIHYQLNYKKCDFSAIEYYEYARRALIGKYYKEALWASKKANNALQSNSKIYYDNIRVQALSYIYLKRYEEAISLIKEYLFDSNNAIKNNRLYYEKLMLALIKAYYHRNNNTIEGDVHYLTALFYRNFPNSTYINILKKWKKYKDIST